MCCFGDLLAVVGIPLTSFVRVSPYFKWAVTDGESHYSLMKDYKLFSLEIQAPMNQSQQETRMRIKNINSR